MSEPHNSDRPIPSHTPPVPRTKRSRTILFATLVLAAGLTGAAVTKAVRLRPRFPWRHARTLRRRAA